MKIFLSHSSKDKDIVSKVYDELGHAICHYDVATFDPTGFLPDEIFKALSESTHFVLFASKAALESPWVEGEIKNAFLGWMRAGVRDITVFLLRDGSRDIVPLWLQSYVVIEHPSPIHIACRVKSKVATVERATGQVPPFYRYDELTKLEQSIMVSTEHMPKAIMVCGADGYGRKQLINELYHRHFDSVPRYKINLSLEECGSEVDLFRAVIGSFSLMTISDLSTRLANFQALNAEERYVALAEEILKVCSGHQALLIDSKDSPLDESGELTAWLKGTIRAFPRTDYPKILLLSSRKPTYIGADIVDQVFSIQLDPLPVDKSTLLFKWWLNRLQVSKIDFVVEQLLELIEGSPKQIELAARLVSNLEIPKGLEKNKRRIFADLERQANELLIELQKDFASLFVLAFIAECGFISEADMLTALDGVDGLSKDAIEETIVKLISYGFILSDDVSLRLPVFLIRTARKLSHYPHVAAGISKAWNQFSTIFDELADNTESSISVLTEACLTKLKAGGNCLPLIDSIILPSQCYRMARRYYDDGDYLLSLSLCRKAYERRIALTNEGAIEVLRIQGLSAARLNDQVEFKNAINSFSEYGLNKKAQRIKEFLLGFEARLEGRFDDAVTHMNMAYQRGGHGDFHILRELAFLHWSEGDFKLARKYIKLAKPRASSNPFILEMEIKIELAFGEGYVLQNMKEIQELIEDLESVEIGSFSGFSFTTRLEYQLALKQGSVALQMIEDAEKEGNVLGMSIRILKVKALVANRRFEDAKNLALKLKIEVSKENRNQRQSALPAITRLLIESTTEVSRGDGIEEFGRNINLLPKKIAAQLKKELLDGAAFAGQKLTEKQKRILES